MTTKIEWTDETFNPLRARNLETNQIGWHCEHVSEGCRNCYAEQRNRGFFQLGTRLPYNRQSRDKVEIFLDEDVLVQPLRWKKPRRVFVCSMTDLFGQFHSDEMIDRVFAVMSLAPHLTFQVLTKRADRMLAYLTKKSRLGIGPGVWNDIAWAGGNVTGDFCYRKGKDLRPEYDSMMERVGQIDANKIWPLPNVWAGTSIEDQKTADERIPFLLRTPAAVRFISVEPLLGPIQLPPFCGDSQHRHSGRCSIYSRLHWVIVGGESGPHARPMHPDWARKIRDDCEAAGVPFFFKQNGEFVSVSEVEGEGAHYHFPDGATVRRVGKKAAGRKLDGREHNDMPQARR